MKGQEFAKTDAYPWPLDAIVLAGTDDNPRRMIRGQNKAFLQIGGRSLVQRAVDALLAARTIGDIYIVGPAERLRRSLDCLPERVVIVEQAGQLLANAWCAIHAAEDRFRQRAGHDDPQRPLLFISSDLPLVSTAAVDDFVTRCAREDAASDSGHSMLAGVAEEASLQQYRARGRAGGIERPYVHLADCRVRLANIYVGRPRTLSHQEFLQTGFDHRKAKKWKNVLQLSWHFLGQAGGWSAAWITLRLQATLLASRRRGRLYNRLRRGNRTSRIEQACSTVLGGSVRMVITPYGGLSLDADNERDFEVLDRRYSEWSGVGPVESMQSRLPDSVGS